MIIIVFVIQSEFAGWYGSGLWHKLGTIEILVTPGQPSVRAGDMTLLSWGEWWEDITELGWLTLCSPPQAERGCVLEDCLYWGADVSFLKTLTTVPFSLHVSNPFLIHLHGTEATSVLFQRCSLITVEISCLCSDWRIYSTRGGIDFFFSCEGSTIFDFFRNGSLSRCLTF